MPKPKHKQKTPTPPQPRWVPWLRHGAPAAVFILYGILWKAAPKLIPHLAQEDSWIEWLTVAAFGSAAVAYALLGLKRGWRDGWFAWGLAALCFLVAGEEVSWGQRLFGFVPPEVFLARNYQEEANLHNIFNEQMGPKWMIVFLLTSWGLVLPVMRLGGAAKLLDKFKVVEPPIVLAPWIILALALLQDYPFEMTAEYIELITGLLFMVTAIPLLEPSRRSAFAVAAPFAAVGVVALWLASQDQFGSPKKVACAQAETRAFTDAIERGAALPGLFERRSIDYRVYTSIQREYLKADIVKALDSVTCEGVSTNPNRRLYALDPWGQPYWLFYQRSPDRQSGTTLVYSFGPNRRYDSPRGSIEGTDDIGVRSRPLLISTQRPE